jgi:hypothetical protein
MKTLTVNQAQSQLARLIAEAHQGQVIVLTHGSKRVTLEPRSVLNPEEDGPELETELLKAVKGPHAPLRESELRGLANRALREHHAPRKP